MVRTPDTRIDYPTIDVPTEQEFQGDMGPQQPQQPTPTPDTRDLPQTPVINVGGVDVLSPNLDHLLLKGSLAVVTTVVTLGATIGVNQAQTVIGTLGPGSYSNQRRKKLRSNKSNLSYTLFPMRMEHLMSFNILRRE